MWPSGLARRDRETLQRRPRHEREPAAYVLGGVTPPKSLGVPAGARLGCRACPNRRCLQSCLPRFLRAFLLIVSCARRRLLTSVQRSRRRRRLAPSCRASCGGFGLLGWLGWFGQIRRIGRIGRIGPIGSSGVGSLCFRFPSGRKTLSLPIAGPTNGGEPANRRDGNRQEVS